MQQYTIKTNENPILRQIETYMEMSTRMIESLLTFKEESKVTLGIEIEVGSKTVSSYRKKN